MLKGGGETRRYKDAFQVIRDCAKKLAFQVRRTMKAIKQVLTERWYSWEDARKLAEKDAEVDLNADLETPAYRPRKSSRLFQVRFSL